MDSGLLKLNETTLLFMKPPGMEPQIVQVTLKTPTSRPTVNQLAEFHLSQGRIEQALIRLVQADMILCAGGDKDAGLESTTVQAKEGINVTGKASSGADIAKAAKSAMPKSEASQVDAKTAVVGVPKQFLIRDEGFEIYCCKEPWVYPLDRWTCFAGGKEIRPAVHKWRFQFSDTGT